ncbi:MAG TPA: tripartite tricarboxylate transporter substrate binding protein [Burkholderiaceae bacterium]|nr:tripartite tricarboxylate transporter substrate binding protein [Burkholderiaceae bacterium]
MNRCSRFFRARLVGTAALFGALLVAGAPPAGAQQKVVRLLVGYAAGGPVDTAARHFAQAFAHELGATVIVENRAGAGGVLAGDAVAKAAPDGNTIFFAASPTLTISPHVQKKMPFDPAKDLTPVAPVLSYANVLVVNKDLPFTNVAELIAFAKANPGKVSYGSAGVGASNHLSGELFAHQTKTQMLHVPYKGNAPAMNDVMGGRLTMMFDIVGSAKTFIEGGQVRALAVTSRGRNPSLPNVPTMREMGLPEYEVGGWFALYGPPGLPADVVSRLNEATRKAVANKEFGARLVQLGYEPWSGSPQTLAAQQKKDFALWSTVTQGIEIE